MKNKLNKCVTLLLSFALVFLFSVPVFAEASSDPTITFKSTDENTNNTIELFIEGIQRNAQVKGVSLVLNLDKAEFEGIDFGKENNNDFNGNVKLENNNKKATLYLTSKDLLNTGEGVIRLGNIKVKSNTNVKYKLTPSELKLVNNISYEQTKLATIALTEGTKDTFELKTEVIKPEPTPTPGNPTPTPGGQVPGESQENKESTLSLFGKNPLSGIAGQPTAILLIAGVLIVLAAAVMAQVLKKRKGN